MACTTDPIWPRELQPFIHISQGEERATAEKSILLAFKASLEFAQGLLCFLLAGMESHDCSSYREAEKAAFILGIRMVRQN